MDKIVGRKPPLAGALGSVLLTAALIASPQPGSATSPAAAPIVDDDADGGSLMVRLRTPAAPGNHRRGASAAAAPAGASGAASAAALGVVEEAMQRAGVRAAASSPGAQRRTAGAASPAMQGSARHVRTLAVGAALIQLPGVRDPGDLQRVADELSRDQRVAYAVVDRRRRAYALSPKLREYIPDDPYYVLQWHWHDPVGGIGAANAWPLSRGQGVVVAVLDTGILPDHPDLANSRLLPGYDFIRSSAVSRRPGFGRAPGALDRGDWQGADECEADPRANASSWHGTHVASAIVESTGNALGMSGLAPGATLLPVRVLGRCGGADSDIVDAIVWASGGHVEGVPDNEQPAEVVNLSLGDVGTCPAPYQEAIDGALARGALVVAAAGNATERASDYAPGNCRGVVTVGATRAGGEAAPYSNHGPGVDLAAPGGDDEGGDGPLRGGIWQASYSGPSTPTSGQYIYKGQTGTSMAAPQVAATAALVQSARVAAGRAPLSPARLKAVLVQSARPFPVANPADQRIGSGIVDPTAALRYALDTACDAASAACAPPIGILRNKVPAVIEAGGAGRHFVFTAEAGRPLTVSTYGGSGNAALYVRYGTTPTSSKYDGRSLRPGNEETVRLLTPKAGTYHIHVPADPAYRDLTVVVRQ